MNKKVLTVELNDNKVIYFGGQTVSGQLIFDCEQSIDIDGIQVTFSGKAFVQWKESNGPNSSKTYMEKQQLFKEEYPLLDSLMQLPSGRSTFPFSFQLPQELPSSVEFLGGYVRYSVKGLIKRPGHHKNLCTKLLFKVLDILDLNKVPHAKQPSSGSDSTTLCCCCCSSGPIDGKVNTDRTGYVRGQFIRANGSIENLSNSDLPGSHFSIVQRITKHASGKSDAISIELVKAPGLPCKRRSTVQLSHQTLRVPAVPPSPLRFCRIIDIEYFLQLCVHTGACHLNLRVNAPLEIGNIRLRDAETGIPESATGMVNTAESSFQSPASSPTTSVDSDQPPAYELPPPSYAMATSVTFS